tara:strand:- start:76 stop:423 length:348 start_codon:yes stop_codon:yes gene_type:complete
MEIFMNVNFKSLFIFGLGLTSTGAKLADRSSTEVDNNNVLGPGVVKEGASLVIKSGGFTIESLNIKEVNDEKECALKPVLIGPDGEQSVIPDGGKLVIPDGGKLVIPDGGNLVLK